MNTVLVNTKYIQMCTYIYIYKYTYISSTTIYFF